MGGLLRPQLLLAADWPATAGPRLLDKHGTVAPIHVTKGTSAGVAASKVAIASADSRAACASLRNASKARAHPRSLAPAHQATGVHSAHARSRDLAPHPEQMRLPGFELIDIAVGILARTAQISLYGARTGRPHVVFDYRKSGTASCLATDTPGVSDRRTKPRAPDESLVRVGRIKKRRRLVRPTPVALC